MGDWIDETRLRQERERAEGEQRGQLLGDLSRVFFTELGYEIADDVEKINQAYPQIYSRNAREHLDFVGGMFDRLEVRIGPTTVLEVVHMQGSHSLEVTRLYRKDARGKNKKTKEHYHLKLDRQDNLYLEDKGGRHIPALNRILCK